MKEAHGNSAKCGFVVSTSNITHRIAGIIYKKKVTKTDHNIFITTSDIKGNIIQETISLPSATMKAYLTIKKFSGDPSEHTSSMAPNVLYNRLSVSNDDVIFVLRTPSPNQIKEVKEKLGDTKFVRCYAYNNIFLTYLKHPSLFTRISLLKDKILNGCNLSILQFIVYQ